MRRFCKQSDDNNISIKYLLPFGGEDLDYIAEDMTLTRAKGNESFIPLGEEENKPPKLGEIIYMDAEGISICLGVYIDLH